MTSGPKQATNRRNGKFSTGPRTASGKSRVAKNAQTHGLTVPISCDPGFSPDVEVLADKIAGRTADTEVKEMARRIAEAHIDLRRVRQVREDLIATALSNPDYESRRALRERAKRSLALTRRPAGSFAIDEILEVMRPESIDLTKYIVILTDLSGSLARLDRYERRALSRRKFAIRAFDAAGFGSARKAMTENRVRQPSY